MSRISSLIAEEGLAVRRVRAGAGHQNSTRMYFNDVIFGA